MGAVAEQDAALAKAVEHVAGAAPVAACPSLSFRRIGRAERMDLGRQAAA